MKTLTQFLNESANSKTIKFDLSQYSDDYESVLTTLKSSEHCTIDNSIVKITITKDNVKELSSVYSTILDYYTKCYNANKINFASSEKLAILYHRFKDKLDLFENTMSSFIENANNDDDKNDENDKNDEKEENDDK